MPMLTLYYHNSIHETVKHHKTLEIVIRKLQVLGINVYSTAFFLSPTAFVVNFFLWIVKLDTFTP